MECPVNHSGVTVRPNKAHLSDAPRFARRAAERRRWASMNRFVVLVFALMAFQPATAAECQAKLSPKAHAVLKDLLELKIKQASERFDAQGRWLGESKHTPEVEKRFYKALEDKSPVGDEIVVYLLNVYMGEHPGEELVCEAMNRGKRLVPKIKAFRACLPPLGLEPLPAGVAGSGVLPGYALEGIASGKACEHED
jgi:hypothetical protein